MSVTVLADTPLDEQLRGSLDKMAPNGSPIFSATQVDTFRLCKRKWAWKYLDGIESEPHASAQLGTDVHAQLEAWLREGTQLDLSTRAGLIALSSLHLLPPPKTCDVERPFVIELFGYRFRGFKDFERGPEVHRSNGSWISGFVGDHKTSTDPSKWGKSADDLRNDTQAILYAAEHLNRFEAPNVELHWNYLRTSGNPKATPVLDLGGGRPIITPGECEPVLERTYEAAKEMTGIYVWHMAMTEKGKRALDIEPNAAACRAFGGCPHIERCNLSANDKIRSLFKMNDKEALLAKMAGNPQLPPAGLAPQINPPTAPGKFVDGQPFHDGKDWHLPDSPGYVAWKAFFASQAVPAAPPTPTPAVGGGGGGGGAPIAMAVDAAVAAAASNGAAAPAHTNGVTTPPSTEQHLTEGLKRRRPRKVVGVNADPKVSAVGTAVEQTRPGLPALATMGQALVDLGSAILELAGVTYEDE